MAKFWTPKLNLGSYIPIISRSSHSDLLSTLSLLTLRIFRNLPIISNSLHVVRLCACAPLLVHRFILSQVMHLPQLEPAQGL
jgi:hypothetical protein